MKRRLILIVVPLVLLGVVGAVALGRAPSAEPRQQPRNAAPTASAAIRLTSHERWRLALPSHYVGFPEVAPEAIFLTTEDAIVAVRHDGEMLWSTPLPDARIYAPRVIGDLVVVASDTSLLAVQRASGAQTWSAAISTAAEDRVNRAAVADDIVVTTTELGRVLGFDRSNGALRWETSIATEIGAEVVVHDGIAVVVGRAEWAAFDTRTGARRWSGDLGLIGTSSPVIAPNGADPLAVVATDEKVLAVGLRDGHLRWTAEADQSELGQVPSVTDRGEILMPDHWGRLTAFGAGDGAVQWKTAGRDSIALAGGVAVLGDRLVALPLPQDGPRIASPDGSLTLRPPSPGWGVARLPDGGLVVSTWGEDQNYLLVYDLDLGARARTR